jgi:hypothetical protein
MYTKKTKTEMLQDIVKEYRKNRQKWPATAKDIASWAIRNKKWEAPIRSQVDDCARELAEAMREELFTDPQGRRVRRLHAMREVELLPDGKQRQLTFWLDIEVDEYNKLRVAFSQRRGQILGDCRQLKTDVDSYNDNNKEGKSVQMVWDFADDLAELEQPSEYVMNT